MMKKEIAWIVKEIVIITLLGTAILFVMLVLFSLMDLGEITYIMNETSSKCCNGYYCSDTYYSVEDNLCHLARCESIFFVNKNDCTYPSQ